MSKEVVNETAQSLIDFLPKVINETKRIAELFHTDREAVALKNMIELIEAYTWVIDALKGIKKNGYLQHINIEEITEFLIEIEDAMVHQDYVTISDLLEYEIAAILERWNVEIQLGIEGK